MWGSPQQDLGKSSLGGGASRLLLCRQWSGSGTGKWAVSGQGPHSPKGKRLRRCGGRNGLISAFVLSSLHFLTSSWRSEKGVCSGPPEWATAEPL